MLRGHIGLELNVSESLQVPLCFLVFRMFAFLVNQELILFGLGVWLWSQFLSPFLSLEFLGRGGDVVELYGSGIVHLGGDVSGLRVLRVTSDLGIKFLLILGHGRADAKGVVLEIHLLQFGQDRRGQLPNPLPIVDPRFLELEIGQILKGHEIRL